MPEARQWALFAVGLLGASLLAGGVLAAGNVIRESAKHSVYPKGVNLDFRRGKVYFSLFTAFIVLGAVAALIPGSADLPASSSAYRFSMAACLPIILVFILILINDEKLTGNLKNHRTYNVLGWATFGLITTGVFVMLVGQIYQLFSG